MANTHTNQLIDDEARRAAVSTWHKDQAKKAKKLGRDRDAERHTRLAGRAKLAVQPAGWWE